MRIKVFDSSVRWFHLLLVPDGLRQEGCLVLLREDPEHLNPAGLQCQ